MPSPEKNISLSATRWVIYRYIDGRRSRSDLECKVLGVCGVVSSRGGKFSASRTSKRSSILKGVGVPAGSNEAAKAVYRSDPDGGPDAKQKGGKKPWQRYPN